MSTSRTHARSPYMEYAKLHSEAKYNLATSGVMSYPLSGLPVALEELETLQQVIASRYHRQHRQCRDEDAHHQMDHVARYVAG